MNDFIIMNFNKFYNKIQHSLNISGLSSLVVTCPVTNNFNVMCLSLYQVLGAIVG